jgi:hypothetical protein
MIGEEFLIPLSVSFLSVNLPGIFKRPFHPGKAPLGYAMIES